MVETAEAVELSDYWGFAPFSKPVALLPPWR
jgi:hypothetical protein